VLIVEFAAAVNASANPSILVITVTKITVNIFHQRHNARKMQIRKSVEVLTEGRVNQIRKTATCVFARVRMMVPIVKNA
ncbi:hypothetical protein OS493_026437, partial [Desmophyllum pertusum]